MKDDLDIAVANLYEGCRSYDEWKDRGRHVRKGEKCRGWIDGVAVFHKDQTEKDSVISYFPDENLERYPGHYESSKPRDDGERVCDSNGREIGTRGYTWHMGEWVTQTHLDSGGTLSHFGGPCGALYTDEFGNS